MFSSALERLPRLLVIAGISLLSLVVVLVALLQIPAVATWVTRRLVTLVPLNPGYALEVGRVSGNWFTGLQLERVRLRRGERDLARLERVRVSYDPLELRGPDRRLHQVVVDGATIVARRERGGWDVANAFRSSGDTTGGGEFAIGRLRVRQAAVAAHLAPDSIARVRDLTLDGRNLVLGRATLLTLDTLHASVAPPGDPPLWFDLATRGAATLEEIRLDPLHIASHRSDIRGRLVLPRTFDDPRIADRLDVRLRALPLSLADLASVYPAVPPEGDLRLEASAEARGRLVTAQLAARLDRGAFELEGGTVVGRGAPAVYRLRGEIRDLDPSRLHRSAPMGVLNGRVEADLRGETLPLADGSAALRLRGSRFGATDLRDLDLAAQIRNGRADLVLRGSVYGGSVRATGWARPFDSVPTYRLAGGAIGLEGTEAVASALAGETGAPTLDVRFRIAGEGVAPREADLSGKLELAAVRKDGGRVALGEAAIRLDSARLRVRPRLLVAGGRIGGLAIARIEDTISYEVRGGRIDRVDLGKLMGDTVAAPLTGRFSLRGRGVTPEQARVAARIELDELRYAATRVEQVIARARVEGGRAVIDLRGGLQGGRLAVNASARPFDSVTTFSIRRAALDSVDLGTLLGRPDLAGPVTLQAVASGRWGESARLVRGRVTLAPSRVGRVDILGGGVTARMAGDRLDYDAAVRTSGGDVGLAGDGRPLAPTPTYTIRTGRADSLDLGTWLGTHGLETSIGARFTGSVSGAGVDSMLARLDLELLPSRVNQAQLGPGRLGLVLDRGVFRGEMHVTGGDAGVDAKLTGDLGPDRSRLQASGSLRVERLARWTGKDADGRIEGRFGLEGVADSAGLLSLGGSVTAVGGMGDVRVRTLHVALRQSPGAIQVDTVVLRSNVAALDGGGRVALRAHGSAPVADTLQLRGRAGDLTPLALLAGADSVTLDSIFATVIVTGPANRWKVDGRADAYRLLYAGNLAERITARGATTIDSAGPIATAGDLHVEGAAAGTVSVREMSLAGRYDSLIALRGTVIMNDDLRLALGLEGSASGDTTRLVLRRLDVDEGGRNWRLARPAGLALRAGAVEVNRLMLDAGRSHLGVNGTFDRRGSSDMDLRFRLFYLDVYEKAGLVPVAGRLDGGLRLSGPAAAPSLEGKVALEVRIPGALHLGRFESELAWTRTGLRLNAAAGHRGSGRLAVVGSLPWRFTLAPEDTTATVGVAREPADTMALAVSADSFDIGMFQAFLPEAAARGLGGDLAVDMHVGGTPDQPRATGRLDVRDLGVSLPNLGVTYSKGRLAGRLDGELLHLDTLRLYTDDEEELLASGRVLLRPLADPSFGITARLRDFRISNSDALKSVATGELALRGSAEKPSLTGNLRLGRTEIIAGGETAAVVEEVQLTPADRLQLVQHFGPAALAGETEGPGFIDRFHLDLRLQLPGQVWFRKPQSPSMDIELTGRINVRQEPGQKMQFFGQVEPVPGRGELSLYGRTFRLVEGDIALQGPAEATTLDVTAEYQVPTTADPDDEDVLINVRARGRPDSLDLEFSAEPPMPEEDVISYIVTGRPASDNPLVAQQDGAGVDASQLAINQLAQNLGGAAGEELGFDVFQIRQEPDRGLTLTAGRYLASRVFVSLQQPLRIGATAEQQTSGPTGPGFELEYALRRWLRMTLRGGSLPTAMLMRGRYAF